MIFPHRVTLKRHTETESTLGGVNRTHAADSVAYRCFFQPQRESLDIVNNSGGRNMVVNIYAEPDMPVSATDQIVFDSKTYEVTGVIEQFSPRGVNHLKITARVMDFV